MSTGGASVSAIAAGMRTAPPSVASRSVRRHRRAIIWPAPVWTTLTCLFAGAFRVRGRETSVSSTFNRVSRDVARARECPPVPKCTRLVPARNRNLAFAGNTICPFAGLLCKPSGGLEPPTPSLPWRIRAAGEGRSNSACLYLFPATAVLCSPAAPLPRTTLTLPEKPRTCPQDLSPDDVRTAAETAP
jgi:hypothetical protein